MSLGDKILQNIDSSWQESKLSAEKQQQIQERVSQHLTQLEPAYPIKLEFRASDMGANAFALPGGKIVLLDDMVNLLGISSSSIVLFLHEMGHIYHRHMLKKLVQIQVFCRSA